MTLSVLLVDDHDLIRDGLRRAFERADDFRVLGEAATAAAALAQAAALSPDVVIVDIRLPDGNGLELTQRLRAQLPECGIVVLTMDPGDEQLLGALNAGASAFVTKNAPAQEVVAAARAAAATPHAFNAVGLAAVLRRQQNTVRTQLTDREQQVLELLAEGLPIERIARQLYVSTSTAKTHIARVYEKLGAANRSQALLTAIRLGLLRVPQSPT